MAGVANHKIQGRVCLGFPLAIAAVSTFLAYRRRVKPVWEDVYNYIAEVYPRDPKGMTRILSLNYNDLGHHLKVCLWHLSVFPEDHPMDHDRVILCWIAEGLIPETHGKTVEELGESYLEELMDRHMIEPDPVRYDGKARVYVISKLMLELIRSESVKENFVTVLEDGNPLSLSDLPPWIRRLSVVGFNQNHGIPFLEKKRIS